jgi:L-lactate utilization protein LutB
MADVIRIQCELSAITDFLTTYIKVSEKCIRPAIGMMEQLALAKDGNEWNEIREKFGAARTKHINNIDAEVQSTQANMKPNMARRIGMLQMLANDAAEDNEDYMP